MSVIRKIIIGKPVGPSPVLDDSCFSFQRVNVDVFQDSGSDSDESTMCGGGPRKRKRLTHLTAEEKLMRRKLKNRVAAQTARDRKKQKMSELEEALTMMEAENRKLLAENVSLKQCTSQLSRENSSLKQRLNDHAVTITTSIAAPIKMEVKKEKEEVDVVCTGRLSGSVVPLESAVLSVNPLPQDHLIQKVVSLTTTQFVSICLMMITLTQLWTSIMKASTLPQLNRTTLSSPRTLNQRNPATVVQGLKPLYDPQLRPWWGSHQKSWNPTMN